MTTNDSALRLLFCSVASYWDPGSGAAITTKELLELMAANGWNCSVFCGSRVDAKAPETAADEGKGTSKSGPLVLRYLQDAGIAYRTSQYQGFDPTNQVNVVFDLHMFEYNSIPVTIYIPDSIRRGQKGTIPEGHAFLGCYVQMLKTFRPDVVLTYGESWIAKQIMEQAKNRGIKVVCAVHNCEFNDPKLFAAADSVWVASEAVQEHYRKKLAVESTPIPNVIDRDRVHCPDIQRAHLTFITPQPTKGVRWFSRIASEVSKKRDDIPILVVKGRATEQWLHNGDIDPSEIRNLRIMPTTQDPRDFYRITRAVLMPSLWEEGFGRVAVECLVNGIPVLASRRGALPEVLGDAGLLFDVPEAYCQDMLSTPSVEEVAPWVETIERLWDDDEFYESYSTKSYEAAEAYRPEKLFERYDAFFRKGVRS